VSSSSIDRRLTLVGLLFFVAAVFTALAMGAGRAHAQYVGTATSGAATADGASAYNNPAAMNAGDESMVELDAGAAFLSASFAPADGGPASNASPIGPTLTLGGYTAALHPDWRLGMTVTIPGTQGGQWDPEDGAGDITRYFMNDGALFHISMVPAVSWSPIEWLSIGVGANVSYGNMTVELDKDLGAQLNQVAGSTVIDSPFPYADPALAAPVTAGADGWGVGAVGGLLVRPIDQLAFGVSVHSPVSIGGRGSLSVEYPQSLVDFVDGTLPGTMLPDLNGNFDLDLSLPWRLGVGVSAYPLPNFEVGLNYVYENTSSMPNFNLVITEASSETIENTTKPQAYMDRHRVQLRAAYLPVEQLRVVVFGSFQSNIVPDLTMAPNNIDFDRWEIGLAARWHIVEELSVFLQYSHIFLPDRTITESLHRPVTQPSLVHFNHPSPTGTYSASADSIRLGLGLHL
jgi:long-subunit fatty acid transport protein